MATTGSVKTKIQGLIDKSNEATGKSDTTMTDAVNSLITKSEEGGISGFYAVNFYNDDRTTLLYTVYVPSGSSAIYAGETPVSTEGENMLFTGFVPAAENVTADLDCYAVYSAVGTLEETSWEVISKLSEEGTAQNYFAIGDTKSVAIKGQIGEVDFDTTLYAYIIGFDHNGGIEGKGIDFGTFKTADGTSVCLCDNAYNTNGASNGRKLFAINHWGCVNYGGWAGCDMRYDILGSTDVAPSDYGAKAVQGRVGYDPTEDCTSNPKEYTLMKALPEDLRAVMKPITKYTDNVGGSSSVLTNVTESIDYLPLPSIFEILGASGTNANTYEQYKQAQYDYYKAGNSKVKYKHNGTTTAAIWFSRTPRLTYYMEDFCRINASGASDYGAIAYVEGIAPIFKV